MLEFQQSTLSVDEGDAGSMTTEQVCLVLSLTDGSTLVRNVEAQVAMIGGTASKPSF